MYVKLQAACFKVWYICVVQIEGMYKKAHSSIREDPEAKIKEKKDVKIKR